MSSISTALQESGRMPDATSYSTFELDTDGGQANVRPPVIEITNTGTTRAMPHNTDLVDMATDDNGNEIGYIYRGLFEMTVQIDIWTAEGDRYSPKEMGESVRTVLYKHDSNQYAQPLPDPDDPAQSLGEIDRFTVGDGDVANDLSMTPALRRWRQTAEIWFHETVNTATEYGAEDYVVDVVGPTPDGFEGGTDVEIIFDATPNDESTADNY